MSRQFTRAYLGIGEVLVELRGEFPDISVSKIRFLESEGLISPARSPSGYRRFGPADIDQLRFILTAQRDQYLPLRVIEQVVAPTLRQRSPKARDAASRTAREIAALLLRLHSVLVDAALTEAGLAGPP